MKFPLRKNALIALPLLAGLLILALFFLTFASGPAQAAAGDWGNLQLTPVGPPLPPDQHDFSQDAVWVVRAEFDDPAQVAQLAARREPWEVHPDQGYLIVEVTPQEMAWLEALGFRVQIDEARTIEFNTPRERLPGQVSGIPGYACYRTVEETFATAEGIVAAHPTLATWLDVGNSWEKQTPNDDLPGYDLRVLKLTNNAVPGPKPKLFVMSSVHAREYAPAELNTRFAEYLVENYGTDADITWLLDYNELHLLLQANPDGRKLAEDATIRDWRKNTDYDDGCNISSDWGTDLNRNFEFQWACCGGSSANPCDETYRGPNAASEPETQAVQNYVRAIFPDQRDPELTDAAPADATGVFLDLHSYSELVLWPWGFMMTPAPNGTQLQTLGRKLAYFNSYEPDQAIGLYVTDGTTDDFAYGDLGVAAYTFEIGTTFFQDCTTFENVIVPDNLPALIYAAKTARTPYQTPAGPDALNLAASPGATIPGMPIALSASINDTRYNNTNGLEPTQVISAAEYSLDTPPWIAGASVHTMTPSDGAFNSKIESAAAQIDTSGLAPGRHILFVRGQDVDGNWGAVSALFIDLLDPAVAPKFEGYVLEAGTNLPLAATVKAGKLYQAESDPATGFYELYVVPGVYNLTASAPDHQSQTIKDLTVVEGQILRQDFSLQPYCAAFGEDVEVGLGGWTADAPWTITDEASHSPSHSFTESPAADYGNKLDISLTSPPINLADFQDVSLDFWQICDTEANYDLCRVEVSTDGGQTWTELARYSGKHSTWQNVNLPTPDLDAQADVRLRFRFTSDSGTIRDGWHLDDIQLIGSSPVCTAPVAPQASFVSSSPDLLGETTVFTNTSTGTTLAYRWDFGDASPVANSAFATHVYPASGLYTVTLTISNSLGSDSFSDTVEILPRDTYLEFAKQASAAIVAPEDVFSYTLTANLVVSGTVSYTLTLRDPITPGLVVLPDSILLNGVPAPDLYDPAQDLLFYQASGVISASLEVTITFEVQVEAGTPPGFLFNALKGQALVNGVRVPPLAEAVAITELRAYTGARIYLPVLLHNFEPDTPR
jgi:PKD repeat protein